MTTKLDTMAPADVWKHFVAISAIPRCSQNEEKVRRYVEQFADSRGLARETDAVGNIVVRRPASAGRRNAAAVCLQGHLDMVCEQNLGTNHDFSRDPLDLRLDGDWLSAAGTTLGADNGIAVAMMLAILESDEDFGSIECLFTIDEETGLTGALGMEANLLQARRLINLDSEEEGFLCIGCAGGRTSVGTVPIVRSGVPTGLRPLRIKVGGLRGGHSGAEIHQGFGNAIVCGARVLRSLGDSVHIAALWGGDKHNAIPREFTADILVAADDESTLRTSLKRWGETFHDELGDREPNLVLSVDEIAQPELVMTQASAKNVVSLLAALPHGVLGMSREVEGLVETSTNIASVRTETDRVKVLSSQRSSRASLIDRAVERNAALFELAGGSFSTMDGYPAWPPNPESSLLALAVDTYTSLTGTEPDVGAFHAGLECGVIGATVEGMDMISFGPDMEGVHTPDERISVSSARRTYAFLVELLKAQ